MANRITADPAASEYFEAMCPQPPLGARYVLTESQRFAQCIYDDPRRHGGIGFVPPVATSADTRLECPYRIGQTVEVVPKCTECDNVATSLSTQQSSDDLFPFCDECCLAVDWAAPVKPTTRRITSIRCEQREGQWCWVVGLGEVTNA